MSQIEVALQEATEAHAAALRAVGEANRAIAEAARAADIYRATARRHAN